MSTHSLCTICKTIVLVKNGRYVFHKSASTSGACAGSDLSVR